MSRHFSLKKNRGYRRHGGKHQQQQSGKIAPSACWDMCDCLRWKKKEKRKTLFSILFFCCFVILCITESERDTLLHAWMDKAPIDSLFFYFFYFYLPSFLLRQQTQHGRHQKREFFRVGSMTALNNDWCHSVIKGRIYESRDLNIKTHTHTHTHPQPYREWVVWVRLFMHCNIVISTLRAPIITMNRKIK